MSEAETSRRNLRIPDRYPGYVECKVNSEINRLIARASYRFRPIDVTVDRRLFP